MNKVCVAAVVKSVKCDTVVFIYVNKMNNTNQHLVDYNNNNNNSYNINNNIDGKEVAEPVDRLINDAAELIKFAHKNGYHVLHQRCVYILQKYLTPQNVWKIFNVAANYTPPAASTNCPNIVVVDDDNNLINSCEQMILMLIKDIGFNLLSHDEILKLNETAVCRLIEMPIIISEYDKFKFCFKWALNGGSLPAAAAADKLRPFLRHINWSCMTREEVTDVIATVPQLFDNAQIAALYGIVKEDCNRSKEKRRRKKGKRKWLKVGGGISENVTNKIEQPEEQQQQSTLRLQSVIQRYMESMEGVEKISPYAELDSTDSWTRYRPMLADQEQFDFYDHDTFWAVSYYRLIEWITIFLFVIGTSYELFLQCFY